MNISSFLYAFLLAALISCEDKKNTAAQATDDHSSENVLDWDGAYKGLISCESCAGIMTTVFIRQDKSFTMHSQHTGHNEPVATQTGQLSWNDQGNTITLKSTEPSPPVHYFVGENMMTLTEKSGQVPPSSSANVLMKELLNIQEHYWKLTELNGQPIPAGDQYIKEPHMIFKQNNSINGFGGCNNMTASYTLSTVNQLSIHDLTATEMACEAYSTESEYFRALQDTYYTYSDHDTLILHNKEQKITAKFVNIYLR